MANEDNKNTSIFFREPEGVEGFVFLLGIGSVPIILTILIATFAS